MNFHNFNQSPGIFWLHLWQIYFSQSININTKGIKWNFQEEKLNYKVSKWHMSAFIDQMIDANELTLIAHISNNPATIRHFRIMKWNQSCQLWAINQTGFETAVGEQRDLRYLPAAEPKSIRKWLELSGLKGNITKGSVNHNLSEYAVS